MKKLIYILPVLIWLASCEKEISVKVPEYTPRLVVNCSGEVNEPIWVSVSKSIGVLNYNGLQNLEVTNATVKLFVNGNYVETLEQNPDSLGLSHFFSKTIVQQGNEYRIVISAPGFTDAEATSSVTPFVPFSVERIRNVRITQYGNMQDEIRISFTDAPARDNHYMLQLWESYEFDTSTSQGPYPRYYGGGCINSSDPSIESLGDFSFEENECLYAKEIFISDELFNGRTKELKLYVDTTWGFSHRDSMTGQVFYGKIRLYNLSDAYYKYLKTYNYASNNSGNPFAEPINVYTNIVNGYGIFSLSNFDEKTFH